MLKMNPSVSDHKVFVILRYTAREKYPARNLCRIHQIAISDLPAQMNMYQDHFARCA